MVSLTLLAVLSSPLDLRLTEFFETASWPEAYGRNIVNVILVDFRALDTFGEVAVVVVAALSAVALLRSGRDIGKGRKQMNSVILPRRHTVSGRSFAAVLCLHALARPQ